MKKSKRRSNKKKFVNQNDSHRSQLAKKVKTETRRLSDQEARELMGDKYQEGEKYLVDEIRMPSDLYNALPPELRPISGVCSTPEEYDSYQKNLDAQEKIAKRYSSEMKEEQTVLSKAIKLREEFESRGKVYNLEGLTDKERVILKRAEKRGEEEMERMANLMKGLYGYL